MSDVSPSYQVMSQLKGSVYRPRVSILGSREQMCVHPEVSEMSGTQQNHMCKALVASRSCKYKNESDKVQKEGALAAEWAAEGGQNEPLMVVVSRLE